MCVLLLPLLGSCASLNTDAKQRQVASVLSFLFPGEDNPAPQADNIAVINVPFRIGIAFVPDPGDAEARLSENERQQLSGKVRNAFTNYPFVRQIEVVPSLYLEPGGGFENLDRVAALLNLDVMVLISYDQVQHADASGWSFLYWTGVGAYVIEGDRYDVLTAVECTIFDIKSRRLLMRASGTSTTRGSATMIGFTKKSRQARGDGFEAAVEQMITALKAEVQAFRTRAPNDPKIKLILPPGYNPGVTGSAAVTRQ